jgi:hypothetical protein
MNPHQVLALTVSDTGLTRISIEGGRIKDMFAYPGSDTIQLHGSGHLFVAPTDDNEPLFVTVMTESGETQDLKLSFIPQKPLPIVLKMPETNTVSKIQLERWMDAALAGDIPRSFVRELPQEETRYTENAVMREFQRYSNGTYVLSLWIVDSRKEVGIVLSAKDLLNPDEGGKLKETKLLPLKTTTLALIKHQKGKKDA